MIRQGTYELVSGNFTNDYRQLSDEDLRRIISQESARARKIKSPPTSRTRALLRRLEDRTSPIRYFAAKNELARRIPVRGDEADIHDPLTGYDL